MEAGRIKKKKKSNFTIVPNDVLQREELSWKAKGLMAYLLSLPEDWNLYKSELVKRSKDGYDSMVSGWNELEKSGYIEVVQLRNNGAFAGYEYIINESPVRDFTEPVYSEQENPQLIYTNSNTSTSRSKTNNSLNLNGEFLNSPKKTKSSSVKPKEEKKLNKESSAHHRIIKKFFEEMHTDFVFNKVHAAAVGHLRKNIETLLKKHNRVSDDNEVGDFAIMMLSNLPSYYSDKDLAVINSKFNEIILQIKNLKNGNTQGNYTGKRQATDEYRS